VPTSLSVCCSFWGFCGALAGQGHYNDATHIGPEMAEVYWHFVDIVWIMLFTLIYILTLF
jgi:heme/copper-type cytochrome/quinol oxidase subunit 3